MPLALFAQIDAAGGVAEIRRLDTSSVVADHPTKRAPDGGPWLRPLVETAPPATIAGLETRRLEYVVALDVVTENWIVERRPIGEQRQAIKDEAGRRILAVADIHKQRNLLAQSAFLARQARVNGSLTPEETALEDSLLAVWQWIEAVRARSDELELVDPIPLDYQDDAQWPTPPGS